MNTYQQMSELYILVFEDMTVKYATSWNDEWDESVNAGILDVIDVVGDGEHPCQRAEGEWFSLDSVGPEGY